MNDTAGTVTLIASRDTAARLLELAEDVGKPVVSLQAAALLHHHLDHLEAEALRIAHLAG